MDEYTKIAGMLEEGRISPEEAEKLLMALDGLDSSPSPEAGRWLQAQVNRADLRVSVDPAAGRPRVEADESLGLELIDEGKGWVLRKRDSSTRIGFFNLLSKRHEIEIVLPAGTGLDLRLGQGAVKVIDPLPGLRTQIGQGQLEFAGAEELDLQLAQGSISGRARLEGGSHRVSAGMGSVKLALQEGTDLRLQIRVGMGEVAVTGSLQYANKKPAISYEDVLGKGRGLLKISLGMGSVEVDAS